MASESSSAMLELTDADEDTEPASLEDGDAPPLIMEHGYDIAVKVDAPMKQLSTLETFVTYRVRCVCARWPAPRAVRRRYNHFKVLHKRLMAEHPWLAAPPLPPLHTARQQLDRYCASFVRARAVALHAFLDRVAKHPIFTHSEDFRIFLTTPDEELDKVFKSDSGAMNLWGLGALYTASDNKPANGPRVKDPEWTAHAEYLSSLQHKLGALCGLVARLHAGQAALAAEMMSMKRCCDAWSSQAGGGTARAAAAVGVAAGAMPRAPPAPRARAVLPLLAGYTRAQVEKIRQRDALHVAYVAGASTTGEMHNKLEQASEAIRSELSDWLPKTRADVKSILLEVADRQVHLHTQMFLAWEHALKLSNEANAAELFKTVSKTAVQNLSPSRCKSLLNTETDNLDFNTDSDPCGSVANSEASEESKNWVEVKNGDIKSASVEKDLENLDEKMDSMSLEQSSKSDVVSDPLREFSDVDLS